MRLVVALCSVAALACGLASGAMAEELGCGALVTSDVTLEASLTGCSTGLVVGADGVTIDLNGFAIEGVGAGAGIDVFGRSGVTVRNGSIRGFESGVLYGLTSGSTVEGLTVTNSSIGIHLIDSTNNRVSGNSLINNSGNGILCNGGVGNQIDGNYAVGNNVGIGLAFCHAAVVDNVAAENRSSGVSRFRSDGSIERNTANGNGGAGIYSSDSHGAFVRNVTNANGGDGLRISDFAALHGPFHSITSHVANANGGYGIAASSFLIDLVLSGVIDGGKNRAHANGAATQCFGVVCR